jgi:exodeoxyribonuclease VII large subunit
MSDLLDDPIAGENAPEFTVSEISGAVKKTIEGAFGRVRVKGEVGRVFRARSGHLYYDIKDDRNVLACTTWKGQVSHLSVVPEEGMEVVVTGKLTTFGAQSKYNLNVDEVAIAGEGALMAMLEKRKKALAAEGLFDPARKKPIPFLPEVIGVITSPSGAVIRDILHRLRDRFPRKVLVWPVAVQGAACAPEVARAIEGFNQMTPGGAIPRPDLLIVARGGGSIEDLWGFNEEIVARAAAGSDIPLISAVGHETDTTLIDYVSDLRAPTPTAAAEHAVPVRVELLAWVGEQEARLTRGAEQAISQRRQRLRDLARVLPNPERLVQEAEMRLDRWGERLPRALSLMAQKKRHDLAQASAGLRPVALTRQMSRSRDRLRDLSARLRPDALTRDLDKRSQDMAQVLSRLSKAAQTQIHLWDQRLGGLERMRQTLGYRETLRRGYAVVRSGETLITSKSAAAKAPSLEIEFQDGRIQAGASTGARSQKKTTSAPDQGSLF